MRNTLLVLHILAVAAWLGGNLTLAFAGSMTRGADTAARRWWAATQGNMARLYFNVAGIVVLLTGIGLVIDSDFISFSDVFVSIGFVAVIIGALLGIFVFGPGCRELVASIDAGDTTAEASTTTRLTAVGIVDSLILILTIVAMVAKWGV
jgi:uncharacterized membrane protein